MLTALVALPVALPTALVALSAALLMPDAGADFELFACFDGDADFALLARLRELGLREFDDLRFGFDDDLVLV